MTVDLSSIRNRAERRNKKWEPRLGDAVRFTRASGEERVGALRGCHDISDDGSPSMLVYNIEQHVRFADYDVYDPSNVLLDHERIESPYGMVRLREKSAPVTEDPIIAGRVLSKYAKHGDLYGMVAYDVYLDDWDEMVSADPSALEDTLDLIEEVERLRAALLAAQGTDHDDLDGEAPRQNG